MSDPKLRHIGVVGASGQFGSAMARLFLRHGARVTGVGRSEPPGELRSEEGFDYARIEAGDGMGKVDDALRPLLRSLDALILSTPIHTLPELTRRYGAMLAPGALLADLGSLKAPVERAMLSLPRDDIELLGVHPLFGPVLPFRGQNVAVVPTRTGPRAQALMDLFKAEGANVVAMSAEEHDAMMAFSQGLSHALVAALGRVALRRGIDLSRLARLSTPFNRCLLLLLGRMASFDAELYSEIQVANPLHVELIDQAIQELDTLRQLLEQGDRQPVTEYMAAPRKGFEADPDDIYEAAHALFSVLPDPISDDPPDAAPSPDDLAPANFAKVAIPEDPSGACRRAFEAFAQSYAPESAPVEFPGTDAAIQAIGSGADAALIPVETSTRAAMQDTHDVESMALKGLRYFAEVIVPAAGQTRMRFVAVARRDQPAADPAKTSILVELEKDRPGALYRMLAPLAIRKINLTRIASSPSRQGLGEYFFQLDFMGSRLESKVLGALEDARRNGRVWVFGSYPAGCAL